MKTNSNEIKEISQKNLAEVIDNQNSIIVDVREKSEFDDFNIGGINIPAHLLNETLKRIGEI